MYPDTGEIRELHDVEGIIFSCRMYAPTIYLARVRGQAFRGNNGATPLSSNDSR